MKAEAYQKLYNPRIVGPLRAYHPSNKHRIVYC
jgi:hypothetical protein